MFEPLDQDVLQQIAETRFDRALVARLDFDEVGERPHLADAAVGVDEHHARGIGKPAAMRLDFLERVEARRHAGQLLLARAHFTRAPFVFEPGAGELRFPRRAGDPGGIQPVMGAPQGFRGRDALRAGPLELDAQLARFHLEARTGFNRALTLSRRGIVRRGQGRDRVEHRVDIRAGLLDVLLERVDVLLRAGVFVGGIGGQCRRFVSRGGRFGGGLAAGIERQALRFATGFKLLALDLELLGAPLQHVRLLRIERNLLLPPVDLELVRMHGLARLGGGVIRGGQLDANAAQLVLDFGEARRRRGFVGAGLVQAGARRFNGFRQAAIAAGEQHLFPAAHLVAQARVAAGLGGLALQRAALLVDLVNDVFEAGQVLLRRFELQLGGAPP
jgi:hypothetical protein